MKHLQAFFIAGIFSISFTYGQSTCSGPNLATNPGFETGNTTGWTTTGSPTLKVVSSPVHSGAKSCLVSNRTKAWNGPAVNLFPIAGIGKTYCISAWVRLKTTGKQKVYATVAKTDGAGTQYIKVIAPTEVTNTQWVQLSGTYEHKVSGTLTGLNIYFEQATELSDFYIDDFSIQELTPIQVCGGVNLISNSGFETGNTTGWTTTGSPTLTIVSSPVNSGTKSCLVSNRSKAWNGPAVNLLPIVGNQKTYCISAWVRLKSTGTQKVYATVAKTDGAGTQYIKAIAPTEVTNTHWVQLSGTYEHKVSGTLTGINIYFEQATELSDFYIDDFFIQELPPGNCGGTNLASNPGFETGTTAAWFKLGNPTLSVVTSPVNSGTKSCYISNRTRTSDSPAKDILPIMQPGKIYCISAWVRMQSGSSKMVATISKTDGAGTQYIPVASCLVDDTRWVQLSDVYEHTSTGTVSQLTLYFEQPYDTTTNPKPSFYIDDLSIQELAQTPDWKSVANQDIDKYRKRDMEIAVSDTNGVPLSGATIKVRQINHDFAFGSVITYDPMKNVPSYTDFFKKHFEWAVFEVESNWYYNEPTQGKVDYYTADALYNFCTSNKIKVRGHCLYWEAVEVFGPDWSIPLSTEALRSAVVNRMNSAVNHFKGKFRDWNVNNEMIEGNFYPKRLGDTIPVWMFKEAKKIDPAAKLFVNDFNILAGCQTQNYVNQIQNLLDDGAPVGAIGCQGHFSRGENINYDVVKNRMNRLAAFNLPIWVTEYDAIEADEYKRADKLEVLYRTFFSHPLSEGILMWGFWQNAHWVKDAYIVNSDWTLNEAGRRYEALMKEWTTDTTVSSSSSGTKTVRGFHGMYEITISNPGCPTIVDTVSLSQDPAPLKLSFRLNCNVPKVVVTGTGDSGIHANAGLIATADLYAVSISPNPVPAGQRVKIVPDNNAVLKEISIYDITGKFIRKEKGLQEMQISTSGLMPGIYIVESMDERNYVSRNKIIIY